LGAYLNQSLRQWQGKAVKIKPEGVCAVHVYRFQYGFKHVSPGVGKLRFSPRFSPLPPGDGA